MRGAGAVRLSDHARRDLPTKSRVMSLRQLVEWLRSYPRPSARIAIKEHTPRELRRVTLRCIAELKSSKSWASFSLLVLATMSPCGQTKAQPPREPSPAHGQVMGDKFGIGAALGAIDSGVVVLSCLPNSPAALSGLQPGDRIVALDGQQTESWSFEGVRTYLLSDSGIPLTLELDRGGVRTAFRVLRQRYSTIVRNAGLKVEAGTDSTPGQLVPAEELPSVKLGDLLTSMALADSSCSPWDLRFPRPRPVFLYFWASWCGPCRTLAARLSPLLTPRMLQDVDVIGINLDESCGTMEAAKNAHGIAGLTAWGGGFTGPAAQRFNTYRTGIPSGFIISRTGQLNAVAVGADSVFHAFVRWRKP